MAQDVDGNSWVCDLVMDAAGFDPGPDAPVAFACDIDDCTVIRGLARLAEPIGCSGYGCGNVQRNERFE